MNLKYSRGYENFDKMCKKPSDGSSNELSSLSNFNELAQLHDLQI